MLEYLTMQYSPTRAFFLFLFLSLALSFTHFARISLEWSTFNPNLLPSPPISATAVTNLCNFFSLSLILYSHLHIFKMYVNKLLDLWETKVINTDNMDEMKQCRPPIYTMYNYYKYMCRNGAIYAERLCMRCKAYTHTNTTTYMYVYDHIRCYDAII